MSGDSEDVRGVLNRSLKMFWIILALSAAVALICYLKLKQCNQYWARLGVPQGNPMLLLGDTWKMFARQQSVPHMIQDMYNRDSHARYCGIYQFLQPNLLLRDPDLIKQIAIKDFDHFVDRRFFIRPENEPFFGRSLVLLTGEKWKDMRSTLSPAFTSSKMKYIFSLMSQTGQQFVDYFLNQKEDIITLEMKGILTKYSNDVIANTVFGIKCNSLEEPDNEFYLMGKEASNMVSIKRAMKVVLSFLSPTMYRLLDLRAFGKKTEVFFAEIVKQNITSRESQGIVRPDVINLLLEARRQGLKHEDPHSLPEAGFSTVQESELGKKRKTEKAQLSDTDIAVQSMTFFIAGFESISTFMCFLFHEMAVNPDVQTKLRQEVDDTLENCQNNLTYEALMGMKYMDMVVSEVSRKWPNGIAIDRVCTKPYTIEPKLPNEKPLRLEEKTVVVIPIYALHRDPQYFPDPERFDPERFNEESRKNIKPYTYFPFGLGPRACIGSRFALMEIKTLVCYLVANFELVPVEKTQIPLKLSKKAINMAAEKDFWLGLKRRSK